MVGWSADNRDVPQLLHKVLILLLLYTKPITVAIAITGPGPVAYLCFPYCNCMICSFAGEVHIQVVQDNGQASSMLSNYPLPKHQWIRMVFSQSGKKVSNLVAGRLLFDLG